jgi:spermidine/putrescine transport system substrate-binding protein
MDCISIPKGAANTESAYKFIDYIMRPEVALEISTEAGYTTPNRAAMELMDEESRNNHLLNPDENDLKNSEFQDDIGDAILVYETYWEKLKTGR